MGACVNLATIRPKHHVTLNRRIIGVHFLIHVAECGSIGEARIASFGIAGGCDAVLYAQTIHVHTVLGP